MVIVAQTLYASTTEHLAEFGTVKALAAATSRSTGSSPSRRRTRRPWAMAWRLALAFGLAPVLARLDMKMIVSPTLAALVFVGTQALCLGAASLSFRKVASLDPAMVFRG